MGDEILGGRTGTPYTWSLQPLASFSSNIVQDTWYPVLAETKNVRIQSIAARQQTTTETVELRITFNEGLSDEIVITSAKSANAGTSYYIQALTAATGAATVWKTTASDTFPGSMLFGQTVKVDIRKTTDDGDGLTQCSVLYHKLKETSI